MEYFILILLIFLSGLFSGSETALFSIGKVAQTRLRQSETATEILIARLLERPRNLLIGVLLGNEVTNVGLSVVNAGITSRFLEGHSLLEQAIISSVVVIPILLIFGEITPKTLASKRPELLGRFVVRPIYWFLTIVRPIVWFLRRTTEVIVNRLSGGSDKREETHQHVDEDEFRTLVDVGAREGVVEAQERALIHNVLDFGDLTVGDIMRPWDKVFSIAESTKTQDAIEQMRERTYSRIPVWRHRPRNIVGILFAKDLLAIRWGVQTPKHIRRLKRTPLFTLARRPAADLLEELRAQRIHIAIVVDEFGQAQGICTMEDLLEELFGPITDAHPESSDKETGERR